MNSLRSAAVEIASKPNGSYTVSSVAMAPASTAQTRPVERSRSISDGGLPAGGAILFLYLPG